MRNNKHELNLKLKIKISSSCAYKPPASLVRRWRDDGGDDDGEVVRGHDSWRLWRRGKWCGDDDDGVVLKVVAWLQ
nr:hypothetical protein [Tanacetum cinerariifolium]